MRPLFVLLLLFSLYATPARALLDAVQATNFSDINFPSWNIGDPAVSGSIDICIYSVGVLSSADYGVTISAPGGFFLKNGVKQIPFSVFWEDSGAGNLGSSSGTQLNNNVKLNNRTNANLLSVTCALGLTGPNARLYVKISQADMTAALAGTYSTTLTILISAD